MQRPCISPRRLNAQLSLSQPKSDSKTMSVGSLVLTGDFPAAGKRTYVNTASIGLMCRSAAQATAAWEADLAENGTANFDEQAENAVFDEVRQTFAELIGASSQDIAVASSASELLSSMAWALLPKRGQSVLGTDVAFPSVMYPWLRISRVSNCDVRWVRAREGHIDEDELLAAIDPMTSIVCLSHVEYATGQVYDLGRIARKAHAHGALLVVDATQSAGSIPLDVVRDSVDILVTGSYKWLCGPFGVGLMYVAPSLQTQLEPGLVGWRSHREIYDLDATRLDYSPGAKRFEFSTMAYGSAIGLSRSMRYLQQIGIEKINDHNLALAEELIEALVALPVRVTRRGSGAQRSSIVNFSLEGIDAGEVIRALGKQNIIASRRRDGVRVSLHLYNTSNDLQRIVAALKGVCRQV